MIIKRLEFCWCGGWRENVILVFLFFHLERCWTSFPAFWSWGTVILKENLARNKSYYKDRVKPSEGWTETQETWHLLWPLERNSTKQCGSEDERDLRKLDISRMIWILTRKLLGPKGLGKCTVYIKRKTVMILFFNISGIVHAAFIYKVKQSGRPIMQEF